MTYLNTRPAGRVRITLASALLLSLLGSLGLAGHPAGAAYLPARLAGVSARTTMPAGLAPVVARTLPRDANVAAVTWSQQAEITTTHHSFNDGIGNAVAISGTTALVSAIAKFNGRGAVYVFVYNGSAWVQQALLVNRSFGGYFGNSLALDGDTALIGDPMPTEPPQGAAWVYVRHGTTWSEQAELTSADGIPNDSFGWTVALKGDTALIGAPDHNTWTGSAYVFTRSSTTWRQQAELTASDAATYNNFGSSVSLSGGIALVGAPGWPGPPSTPNFYEGKVYAFARSGGTWTQQAAFIAGDATTSEKFGGAVALDGDTALIGATGKINNTGAAYVFVYNGSAWTQQTELRAGDASADHYFGQAISLSGDTALVGAPALYPCSCIGSAYIFVRSGSAWAQQAELFAGDSVLRNFLGISVALSGNKALVGATGALPFNGGSFGAAYMFVRNGTSGTAESHGS